MVIPDISAQSNELGSIGRTRERGEREGFAISWDGRNSLGAVLRDRRSRLGLTLSQVAERVGCAKSYLSQIETGVREKPPSMELIGRLEAALGLDAGQLVEIANWETTPASVRERVATSRQAARRLRELLASTGSRKDALDRAFGSGELRRLVDRLDPMSPGADKGLDVVQLMPLPREVPVINKVTAGYPTEFTDLGYPARVADEYLKVPDIDDADAFGARVVGDSMEPEYREGDVVVFSPRSPVTSGTDCFVRLEPDQESTFKRVYFEKDESGAELIRLQPLNSRYPPMVVPREKVAGLYSGVSVVRSLLGLGGRSAE
ncbi:MAG: helix-turn-helix domain-containing protein [Phycisphaera sp.]|nr:MAG: helix-turn-helix domain-containing protein [Phycisphaera sp.]